MAAILCFSGCVTWFFPKRVAFHDGYPYYEVLRMPDSCEECGWAFIKPVYGDNTPGPLMFVAPNVDTLVLDVVDSIYVGDMSRKGERFSVLAGGLVGTGHSRRWACPKCGAYYAYSDFHVRFGGVRVRYNDLFWLELQHVGNKVERRYDIYE